MENLRVRCRVCNKEIEGYLGRTVVCGCANMATICGNRISAVDLSNIVMLTSTQVKVKSNVLTNEDIAWQEERRKRQVRRLDFEVR
jgi:hypothetical protein